MPPDRTNICKPSRVSVCIAAIALDLGVSDPTLRSWVRQAEIDAGARDGLMTSERIELAQLRREVRVLK